MNILSSNGLGNALYPAHFYLVCAQSLKCTCPTLSEIWESYLIPAPPFKLKLKLSSACLLQIQAFFNTSIHIFQIIRFLSYNAYHYEDNNHKGLLFQEAHYCQ